MTGLNDDTIVAPATPAGSGALGIVRLSGKDAIRIADSVWKGRSLAECRSHTVHLGNIEDENGNVLDRGVATVFAAPNSFTGEDSVEFTLHGSPWIMREVTGLLLRKGARCAEPGEFSRRAYLNGRMDLASAEGVADLISSSSRAAHRLAMMQTRGDFSREFNSLRDKLIELASLLELELDFSEEDVEFADRSKLKDITERLLSKIDRLTASYAAGRAFKEGVPVVISGVPNVGKSTLLNALLQEDKAIVSDIPGTTRDIIEDTCEIEGVLFRFVDTAGLRESEDAVENLGIGRALKRLAGASIILWLIDPTADITIQMLEMKKTLREADPIQTMIPVITKSQASDTDADRIATAAKAIEETATDASGEATYAQGKSARYFEHPLEISAKEGIGVDRLRDALKEVATCTYNPEKELLLTNARHYGDLLKASEALRNALSQMQTNASADFIAMDIREATAALSSLTGAITTPDLLHSIFSHFCIGK